MAEKSKPQPAARTTDDIIRDLIAGRDAQLAAGEPVDVHAVEQRLIAHQQMARLRTERARRVVAKDWARVADLDAQIGFWRRMVAEDVDEQVAADPALDATTLVDGLATEPADGAVQG
ncbi:hypothetical protein [Krasilnikovia sp. MM14-A1259]|uniref:hypothetical protein n=1 Tax=Krasilnikovia sp. MM14-A1259 TaxID=3373539 RepID=UPI0038037B80